MIKQFIEELQEVLELLDQIWEIYPELDREELERDLLLAICEAMIVKQLT